MKILRRARIHKTVCLPGKLLAENSWMKKSYSFNIFWYFRAGLSIFQKWRLLTAVASLLLSGPAFTIMDPTTIAISVSGTVVADGRCSFNSDKLVSVNFGDVFISEIAAGIYRQPLNYSLSCSGDDGGKSIQIQLAGTGANFDSTVLSTDAIGLGIKLLRNNNQMELGRWYDVDPALPPKIESLLIVEKDATFANGQDFSATATLKVAFN